MHRIDTYKAICIQSIETHFILSNAQLVNARVMHKINKGQKIHIIIRQINKYNVEKLC